MREGPIGVGRAKAAGATKQHPEACARGLAIFTGAFTAATGTQANPQRFEEMMLIVTAVAVLLTSLSILLAFIVLEGDVLPQEWAKFLPPAKATLQPHELVWANNRP